MNSHNAAEGREGVFHVRWRQVPGPVSFGPWPGRKVSSLQESTRFCCYCQGQAQELVRLWLSAGAGGLHAPQSLRGAGAPLRCSSISRVRHTRAGVATSLQCWQHPHCSPVLRSLRFNSQVSVVCGFSRAAGRGLTLRSRGAPTACHLAPATGTVYIFCGRGQAPRRWRPLSSNVRHH